MKTKIITISFLCLLILNCGKQSPTFNPFDELFDIDIEMIYNDTTLKIVGDCSAFMHIKNQGEHEAYYAIYISSKRDSIVGKGLNILLGNKNMKRAIDSKLSYWDSTLKKKQIEVINYVKELPFDTIKVDSILNIYSLTRGEEFMKRNLITGQNDYFIICENPNGTKYLFENRYEHIWLSNGKVVGKRLLNFDTQRGSKKDLENDPYYTDE